MSITRDEVRKIAQLARIEISPAEEERYAETISAVLEYMKILGEVDTDRVAATFQVTGLHDVVRDDEPRDTDDVIKKKILAQMPQTEMNELVVPGVFNGE